MLRAERKEGCGMPVRGSKGGDGKRYPLNMRTTKEIRERLERAAAKSGRSLAQEVEYRLERSFDREATERELLEQQNIKLKTAIEELSKMIGDNFNIAINNAMINLNDTVERTREMLEQASDILGIDISTGKKRRQRKRS
jgi:uncharacterized protein (DUF1778 family)